MLGKLFGRINDLLIKKPLLYGAVMASCVCLIGYGTSLLTIDDSINAIFPQGEQFERYEETLTLKQLNRQVIFSFNKLDDDDSNRSLVDSLISSLRIEMDDLLENWQGIREVNEGELLDRMMSNFPYLVNEGYYGVIEKKLQPDSIQVSMRGVYSALSSPMSYFMTDQLQRDPLQLALPLLEKLKPHKRPNGITIEEGLVLGTGGKRVLFFANLTFDINDHVKANRLRALLDNFKEDSNAKKSSLGLDYFGSFLIADDNVRQVKKDTLLTVTISLALILAILILYYRNLLTPVYFLLPTVFGGMFGLGVSAFFNPQVAAISLATSAILLGIILDYSFHFFTHYKHTGDLTQTVRELAMPMTVGSTTTVMAFGALIFTNSGVLQDFGWIALFSLTGAALFTLLLLPPLIQFTGFKMGEARPVFNMSLSLPKAVKRLAMIGVVALTILFAIQMGGLKFDGELQHLNYHTAEMKTKEAMLTGVDPESEVSLNIFAKGNTKEEAIANNFALYEALIDFQEERDLPEMLSIAPLMVPDSVKSVKLNLWRQFWSERLSKAVTNTRKAAEESGLYPEAFAPFETWVNEAGKQSSGDSLLGGLGVDEMLFKDEDGWHALTKISISKDDLLPLRKAVAHLNGIFVMDISSLASSFLDEVVADFNYLLLFSSILVFISLFLVYGRLELAIFSFLPMIVSWVWILGISAIFGIPFNFVNIILATIIFGLGDDYSIFMTDGLLKKYRTGVQVLPAYKTGILLSAITTMIGTGVLIFAGHPAIKSVALLSVIGIGCILLFTLFFQPILFNWFVANRVAKGKSPLTLFKFVWTVFLLGYFFMGCLFMHVLAVFVLPLPDRTRRGLLNWAVSKLTGSVIFLCFYSKKIWNDTHNLDFSKPSIIIANHTSILDILLISMMNPKVVFMVKKWVYKSPFFGFFVRNAGYIFADEGAETNLDKIKDRIDEGYSIVIFPEGTRSPDGDVKRFHKGAFFIAQELKLDLQPILIQGAFYAIHKGDFLFKGGDIHIVGLPRIKWNDNRFGENYTQKCKAINHYFRDELKKANEAWAQTDFWKRHVMYNFTYKGPVEENYLNIKWQLEKEHIEEYDRAIGDRKVVLDVGCGLGYVGYYLHYRRPERKITGFDYDLEKIELAQSGYNKTSNLAFHHADLLEYEYPKADAILLIDVLHYLKREEQTHILKKLYEVLNADGVLIIRDGISTDKNHSTTVFSEFLSNNVFKFNKSRNQLSFLDINEIQAFAASHNMSFESKKLSENTSNHILFLTKKHIDANQS